MIELTENQLKLLRELRQFGGVLIVRLASNKSDYGVLEKAKCVDGVAVNEEEIRYKITKAGKDRLNDHRDAGRGSN